MILHLHSRNKRAIQLTTAPLTPNLFSPCSWHVVAAQPGQLPSPSAGDMIRVMFSPVACEQNDEQYHLPTQTGTAALHSCSPILIIWLQPRRLRKVPLLGQQQQYREDLGSCTTIKSRAMQTRCFPSQMSCMADSLLIPLSLGASATKAQSSSY